MSIGNHEIDPPEYPVDPEMNEPEEDEEEEEETKPEEPATMRVTVTYVTVPAWSTVGFGEGFNSHGDKVYFTGDHRPMRYMGEAVAAGEDVETELEGWMISRIDKAN